MRYLSKCNHSFGWLLLFNLVLTFGVHAQLNPTPAEERDAGYKRRLALDKQSAFDRLTFRNIGPVQMNGRVTDLEVNPNDPTEFYLAYASGGLWHTVNNGLSFKPLFDQEAVMTIGDIAVNWETREIWIGTGEVNSSRSSYAGNGVYKSSNQGKTWEYLGLPESHHIGKILLHPQQPQTVWVAAMGHLYSSNRDRGIYRTTDGGKTWKHVLFVDEHTGAVELEMNPNQPNELFAATWKRSRKAWEFYGAGASSAIYRSTDGGLQWTRLTTPTSGFPTGDSVGRIGISVSASQPGLIYAVVDNQASWTDTSTKKVDSSKYQLTDFKALDAQGFARLTNAKLDTFLKKNGFPSRYKADTLKQLVAAGKLKPTVVYDWLVAEDGFQQTDIRGCEVYRSNDHGVTWEKTNTERISIYYSYGYYFGKIYCSPTNPNKLVILGVNLLLSTDGGKTFTETDKDNTHADWHACWFNPKKDSHWITGNDGGCNITYDNGTKWFMVTSIPAGQFYAITTDNAKPYNVYGGLQDNGTWVGPSRLGTFGSNFSAAERDQPEPEDYPWTSINGGDGMQVQVDTRDNQTVYTGYQFGFYSRKSKSGERSLSIHPMHDLGEPKLRYNWQTPILLSKHQQDILYFGSNKVHRSLNKGEQMVALSNDLTKGKKAGNVPFGTLTTLSESPTRFGLLYAGTDDGLVHLSTDGGYSWKDISKGLPPHYWVSRIVASRHREGRVWVTLNGYRFDHFRALVFVSEDYGNTWTSVGTDLPAEPVNVIREDALRDSVIYVGTDHGLYTSFNRGRQFMTLGVQLPRVAVHDLAIQERDRELVVGTHGRSIFICSLDSVYKLYDSVQQVKQKRSTGLNQPHWKPQLNLRSPSDPDCPTTQTPRRKNKRTVGRIIPNLPPDTLSYAQFQKRLQDAVSDPTKR